MIFKDLSKVIKNGWKVYDLGSGDQPLKEATTYMIF